MSDVRISACRSRRRGMRAKTNMFWQCFTIQLQLGVSYVTTTTRLTHTSLPADFTAPCFDEITRVHGTTGGSKGEAIRPSTPPMTVLGGLPTPPPGQTCRKRKKSTENRWVETSQQRLEMGRILSCGLWLNRNTNRDWICRSYTYHEHEVRTGENG